MPVSKAVGRTTRDYLKEATAQNHDRLDLVLGKLVADNEATYTEFLEVQLRARIGIEAWLNSITPEVSPPSQIHLIRQDLASMGHSLQPETATFNPPADADPLGTSWVLAGSCLGNRALLARLKKVNTNLPTTFLSDPKMIRFWQKLRPSLERPHNPADDRQVLVAAQATFSHFLKVTTYNRALEAA